MKKRTTEELLKDADYLASMYRAREGKVFPAGISQEMKLAANALNEARILIAELSGQLREREWQPIETAPKNGGSILVYGRFGAIVTVFRSVFGDKWLLSNGDGIIIKPTHWMPLPTPPKKDNNNV